MEYKAELFLRNINNLSDARFAASEGFFALSYNLSTSSESFMSISKIRELNEWVAGPIKVAEFDETIPDFINDALDRTELELAMLPYSSALRDLKMISNPKIIKLRYDDINKLILTKLKLADYLFIELDNYALKSKTELKTLKSLIKDTLFF